MHLQVIDWLPGGWFLFESSNGDLLLDARYSYSGLVDSSALLKLDADEVRRFHDEGRDFVAGMARSISNTYVTLRAEPQVYSKWWERDLYRGDDRALWVAAVGEAIQAWPAWVEWRAKR